MLSTAAADETVVEDGTMEGVADVEMEVGMGMVCEAIPLSAAEDDADAEEGAAAETEEADEPTAEALGSTEEIEEGSTVAEATEAVGREPEPAGKVIVMLTVVMLVKVIVAIPFSFSMTLELVLETAEEAEGEAEMEAPELEAAEEETDGKTEGVADETMAEEAADVGMIVCPA